ncbi:MAG: cytochrome P450, partial [Chloroflexota bacterium]
LVSGADEFQYVLRDKQPNFIKSPKLYDAAKMMIGNGLVTSNGDFWLRQRRMIQPYFHRQQIANFTQMMVDGIADVLDTWQDGEERELKNSMSQITIEVISRTMFGENVVSEKEMQQVADDLVFLADYVALRGYMPFIPLSMPVPGHGRYKAAMARLHKIVERIIVLGEQTPESGNLISMLVHATDEETNEQMTRPQLFDETMTMFSAGFETTSTTVAWLLYLLDQHPEIKQRVQAEIDDALGTRKPTFEDFRKLPYCRMVFQEALRYYPASPMIPRTTVEDDEINGQHIPANTMLLMFIYGLHHNPKLWDNPEVFDPERFAPDAPKQSSRFAYMPFSTGPRKCIGDEFAQTEGILMLAMIMQRYEVEILAGQAIVPNLSATLTPKNGIQVK